MKRSTRILWGLFAPVVAAVLFVAGEFVLSRPDLLMNPGADPEAFAQMVTGSGFAFYAGRGVVGVFLETVGMIALYLYLENNRVERLAFWGVLISILGDMVGAAFFGSMLLVYPSVGAVGLEGQTEAVAALGLSPALLGAMFVLTVLGLGLLAVAIWRSGSLPRWSGIVMLVGFLLLLVQIFAVQVLGNVVWGLGALWIFVRARRRRDA